MNLVEALRQIRGKGNRSFVRAWMNWRGEHIVPARSDMRLQDIAALLPHVRIAEIGDDDVTVRLAGTALREIYGMELTGKSMRAISSPQDWPGRHARHLALIRQPCMLMFETADTFPDGKIIRYETVSVPLRDRLDEVIPRVSFTHVEVLERTYTLPSTTPREFPKPSAYWFVDIGAGVPDPT